MDASGAGRIRGGPERRLVSTTPGTAAERALPAEPRGDMRRFLIIWAAQLIARTGNGLTAFGIAVHVYEQTGLSTSVALVTMAAFLPGVLLAPLGGVLADRFDRRLLMVLGDTVSAIGLGALLLLLSRGTGDLALLCACIVLSAIPGAVMEPAYRATVSDLLPPAQYARASGLVQLASASQYLLSPAIAGFLMAAGGIRLVLTIDIATMLVTILCMLAVRRGIEQRRREAEAGFWAELRFGIAFLARQRGLTVLLLLVTVVTFCMGFLQTLFTPMLLELSDERMLGLLRSTAAIGMLVSSLAIGVLGLNSGRRRVLSLGLAAAGAAVLCLGASSQLLLIGLFAFLFFATLPPLNTSLEVLARGSIPNEVQGRVWGVVGLVSQLGYILAYAVSGPLADLVFTPLLLPDGPLADSLGRVLGTGPSRGIGLMFMLAGLLLAVVALLVQRSRSVRELERTLRAQLAPPGDAPRRPSRTPASEPGGPDSLDAAAQAASAPEPEEGSACDSDSR